MSGEASPAPIGTSPGILETADNGTVLLDEVGEMSLRMQAALLRFLETGELQRVGADRAHARVNVRVLAATNRDFAAHIASGAFRQDLFYRLNVISLHMPPLRDRREDIPHLLEHFLERCSQEHRVDVPSLTPEALEKLMAYDWPGNVRQLKNAVERIVLKRAGASVAAGDLPIEILRATPSATARLAEPRGQRRRCRRKEARRRDAGRRPIVLDRRASAVHGA